MPNLWQIPKDGPDPVMKKCIRCKGKGYYNGSGFTSNPSKNQGECYLCKGRQEYPSNYYTQCLKCSGKGFWYTKGLCGPWAKTGEACTNCEGAGYQRLENPDNELRPIKCLMCKAKGQFYYKGWIHQGNKKFIKGDCPCCEGKGVLMGNFSRCKRCKGKGAFGKKGIVSQWQKPEFKLRDCGDCEGKGFLKEEEPVEDDSESVETDEDSDMKNQSDDSVQPGDDVGYFGGNEEEEEEEEDPTPEPEHAKCDRCSGKGFYGSGNWTNNEKIKKGDCPLCKGKAVYIKNYYRECLKCNTKGYFSPNVSPTNIWNKLAKPCNNCDGVGYNKIDFENNVEQQKCLMCKGKGHYGNTTYCFQEQKIKKGDCPCCEGSGTLYGTWEKCNTCKGKGGFKGKNTPVFCYVKSRERDCDDCQSRGFIQEKKEEEEERPKKSKKKKKKKEEEEEESSEEEEERPKKSKKKKKVKEDSNEEEKENEQEEPKEEEKEKEIEEPGDGLQECARCGGKGHYNAFGWCNQGATNKKGDCPLCVGKGRYDNSLFRKCNKCEGKGFFNTFGPTNLWNTSSSKQPCSCCNEIGYLPTRPETQLKEQPCVMCEGKGHYNTFRWCGQNKRKGECPLCLGKSEVYGNYTQCSKCEGKGAFNSFGPCEIYKNSPSKENCSECDGKGYSRSEEQDKLEQEEKEKYGYDNSIKFELGPPPEGPPPGEGCCIIL